TSSYIPDTPRKEAVQAARSHRLERGHHEPRLRRAERHSGPSARARPLELGSLRREARGEDRRHARRRDLRPAPRAVARALAPAARPAAFAPLATPRRFHAPVRPP